jgi:hypothetical protein
VNIIAFSDFASNIFPIFFTLCFKPEMPRLMLGRAKTMLEDVIHTWERDQFIANMRVVNSSKNFDCSAVVKPKLEGFKIFNL